MNHKEQDKTYHIINSFQQYKTHVGSDTNFERTNTMTEYPTGPLVDFSNYFKVQFIRTNEVKTLLQDYSYHQLVLDKHIPNQMHNATTYLQLSISTSTVYH